MTPQEQVKRGTYIVQEFAEFSEEEMVNFSEDLDCLKLWVKARLHDYGAEIVKSQEMQTVVSLGLEAAYNLGALRKQYQNNEI